MRIEKMTAEHLITCAALLKRTYNCPPWNDTWTDESSLNYLTEYFSQSRFAGFLLYDEDNIIGASFCREKTWYTADELFVDELFISPDYQGKGHGAFLLKHMEDYAINRKLAGVTLLTNRYMPSLQFYKKNGYIIAEHVVFMYKELK